VDIGRLVRPVDADETGGQLQNGEQRLRRHGGGGARQKDDVRVELKDEAQMLLVKLLLGNELEGVEPDDARAGAQGRPGKDGEIAPGEDADLKERPFLLLLFLPAQEVHGPGGRVVEQPAGHLGHVFFQEQLVVMKPLGCPSIEFHGGSGSRKWWQEEMGGAGLQRSETLTIRLY